MSAPPFDAAAPFYDHFRPPYPQAAFDHLVSAFGLDRRARVLDLGCGPGTIALRLSARVAEVVAVDPERDMIAEGRRLAAARGRGNILWTQARAEDLSADLGPFRLAVMGQSFHWMDRDRVLGRLSQIVEDGGGLALVNPGRRRPQESWEPAARDVVARYLGPFVRHPRANPLEPEHEPALRRSSHFRAFTRREFPSTVERTVASIIGFIYSWSDATRPRFGARADDFELELGEALLRLNPSGRFTETIETEVLIAPKIVG